MSTLLDNAWICKVKRAVNCIYMCASTGVCSDTDIPGGILCDVGGSDPEIRTFCSLCTGYKISMSCALCKNFLHKSRFSATDHFAQVTK